MATFLNLVLLHQHHHKKKFHSQNRSFLLLRVRMPEPRRRELPTRYRDEETTEGHLLANESATNRHNTSNSATRLPRSSQNPSKSKTTATQKRTKGILALIQGMS